jgi:hypothetical protein
VGTFDKYPIEISIRLRTVVKNQIINRNSEDLMIWFQNYFKLTRDKSSVADPDPGFGAFLTPGSGIRDPGWLESQHPDKG